MAGDHNRAYGARMVPTTPSPSSQPGAVKPASHPRHTTLLVVAAISAVMACQALTALVMASRNVRTVPGDCARPWHCTTTTTVYNPITIVMAIGMVLLLVWQLRTVRRFWRARGHTPPPSSVDAWLAVSVTALASVPAFLVSILFFFAAS